MNRYKYVNKDGQTINPSVITKISIEEIPVEHPLTDLIKNGKVFHKDKYIFYTYDNDIYIHTSDLGEEGKYRKVFLRHWSNRVGHSYSETILPAGAYDVLCPCGNHEFSLKYGDYELRARCTCGNEESVYSG
jgi:hypothetical protein